MSVIKVGCFIEPEENLLDHIMHEKELIPKYFEGPYMYLSHPPHLTLFTLHVSRNQIRDLIFAARKEVKVHSNFFIETKNIYIFYNDVLTGGHTVTREVRKSQQLEALQMRLIEAARPFRDTCAELRSGITEETLKTNFEVYGFPFVGEIWVPHITISSIGATKNNVNALNIHTTKLKYNYSQNVSKVSYWLIKGDNHKKLTEIELS